LPRLRPIALTTTALLLTCCGGGSGLDDVFAAGADSTNAVALYYDALAGLTLDSWRESAAYGVLRGEPLTAKENTNYEVRMTALKHRADLAHRLATLYQTMTKSRDAAGLTNVTSAGEQLGKSLAGVPNLPGADNIDAGAFGEAAAFLVDLKRQKDLRRGLKALNEVAGGLKTVFDRESPEYKRLSKERDRTAENLLRALSEKNAADPGALLKELPLGVPIAAVSTEEGRKAGLAIAGVDVFRARFAWECVTAENAEILAGWIAVQKQAASGSSPDARPLRGHIARANGCMAEYKDIARIH
jgi:hypothetical protein